LEPAARGLASLAPLAWVGGLFVAIAAKTPVPVRLYEQSDMGVEKLVDLALTLTEAIRWYWNFYVTVILAILGWFITQGPIPHRYRPLLTCAFVAFVAMNLLGLVSTSDALRAAAAEISALAKGLPIRSDELKAYFEALPGRTRFQPAWFVHLPIDCGILFLIWTGQPRQAPATRAPNAPKA